MNNCCLGRATVQLMFGNSTRRSVKVYNNLSSLELSAIRIAFNKENELHVYSFYSFINFSYSRVLSDLIYFNTCKYFP